MLLTPAGLTELEKQKYDIVLHIDNLTVNDAVEILVDMARRPCFQTTQESRVKINDFHLAAKAHATIFDRFPSAEVKCKSAIVCVKIETSLSLEQEVTETIHNMLGGIDGIKE